MGDCSQMPYKAFACRSIKPGDRHSEDAGYTQSMCGRYNIIPDASAWADVGELLSPEILEALRALAPRYNVAPTQTLPIIVMGDEGRPVLIEARWGFIPHYWTKSTPPPMTTNARSETAATKPMWKYAWRNQRCLIPASGWYEWFVLEDGRSRPPRIPHLVRKEDGKHILFAGLWSMHGNLPTCSIVTIKSPPSVAEIHSRTPVVLHPDYWNAWIDPAENNPDAVSDMIQNGATKRFVLRTVGPAVGNSRNQGADLIEPYEWEQMTLQGKVTVDEDVLRWLTETPADELRRALAARLDKAPLPSAAERRLWFRTIEDRDDAEALADLMAMIRDSLRATKTVIPKPPPDKPQQSLF